MARIVVWVMDLEKREKFTLTVGSKQDPARALFTGLLPPGDTCYTAAEVVRFSLPSKADQELRVYHYKALNALARLHGLGDGLDPGPDNVDEKGRRLPGTKPGKLQPCKWNRESWLRIISDETYQWLVEFNQELEKLTGESPPGSTFYCDLDSFEITVEAPAKPAPRKALPDRTPVAHIEDKAMNQASRFRCNWPRITTLVGLGCAVLLVSILWNTSPRKETRQAPDLQAQQKVSAYLKRNRMASDFNFPSLQRKNYAATWKASPSTEMLVMDYPPRMFIADNR